MTIIDVKCEICSHWLAKADTDDLVAPINGSMFQSRDPAHGFPKPFTPDTEWLFLFCPMCKKRAFYDPDKVTDINGKRHIARDPALANVELLPKIENKPAVIMPQAAKPIPTPAVQMQSKGRGKPFVKGNRHGR